MRIAYLSHFYPPKQTGGIEQNTHALASGMLAAGHDVKVLCVDNWSKGDAYWQGYTEDSWEGVPVRRLNVNWQLAKNPNGSLYDNPFLAERTRELLDEFQPDIVHITSTYTLSMRIVETVRDFGAPCVMTLSDFWLVCPRVTLVRRGGEICDGRVSASTCQDCLLSESPLYRAFRSVASSSVAGAVCGSILKRPALAALTPGVRGWGQDVRERREAIARYLPYIDLMIAPSRYVAGLIRSCGLEMKVEISHHGNHLGWLSDYRDRPPDGELRFGYMGQVRPHKGVHLLIEAFRENRFPAHVKLLIHGKLDDAAYASTLRKLADGDPNIRFEGAFQRQDLPNVLRNIDVLVTPSTWPEVAGLVVQEAFAARKPVLASDMGGLPEFVRPGEGGVLFDPAVPGSLREALAQIFADGPEGLAKLRAATPRVRTVADEQVQLENVYRRLVRPQRRPSFPIGRRLSA